MVEIYYNRCQKTGPMNTIPNLNDLINPPASGRGPTQTFPASSKTLHATIKVMAPNPLFSTLTFLAQHSDCQNTSPQAPILSKENVKETSNPAHMHHSTRHLQSSLPAKNPCSESAVEKVSLSGELWFEALRGLNICNNIKTTYLRLFLRLS